jgi:hypothetical protein
MLGPANGVASLEQMRQRIEYYRREPAARDEDPLIGCVFVRDVTFFPDDLTFDPPPEIPLAVLPQRRLRLRASAGHRLKRNSPMTGGAAPAELRGRVRPRTTESWPPFG